MNGAIAFPEHGNEYKTSPTCSDWELAHVFRACPAELPVKQSGGVSIPTSADLIQELVTKDTSEAGGVVPLCGRTEFAQPGTSQCPQNSLTLECFVTLLVMLLREILHTARCIG